MRVRAGWWVGLSVILGALGCDRSTREIDAVSYLDEWFHPSDAGGAFNIRFGSDQVFTSNVEGCDAAGILHTSWVREGLDARVPSLPGSPLFRASPFAESLQSSVPVAFGGGTSFDTFVRGGLCPVCSGGAVEGVTDCPTPLRDGGT
jgi:hypothetical protein